MLEIRDAITASLGCPRSAIQLISEDGHRLDGAGKFIHFCGFLHCDPINTLQFSYDTSNGYSSILRLRNVSPMGVAFRVLTTQPDWFTVIPRVGVIMPGEASDVQIRAKFNRPGDTSDLDKVRFKLRSLLWEGPFTGARDQFDTCWHELTKRGIRAHERKFACHVNLEGCSGGSALLESATFVSSLGP